jgi:tetratricopeptide (TPR) repeat protein
MSATGRRVTAIDRGGRGPVLGRVVGWLRWPLRPRLGEPGDPAVQLATFLDDGERRDRQLLELREQAFGPDHAEVATALHILGARYHLVRRYKQAEALYDRALSIRTERLGPDHPSTLEVLEDLGDLWRDCGDHQRAATAYDRALMPVTDPVRRRRKQLDYQARLAHIESSMPTR